MIFQYQDAPALAPATAKVSRSAAQAGSTIVLSTEYGRWSHHGIATCRRINILKDSGKRSYDRDNVYLVNIYLVALDGLPGTLLSARFRSAYLGHGFLGRLLLCFWCHEVI